MKKQVAKVVEVKKEHKLRKYFLYSEGNGFITVGDGSGMPTFNNGEPLFFESRAKAKFARDFFITLKLANSIDILSKVA